ncbi:hypothetical protein BLSTO_05319 [Blastocystis sp. subtype 1]
MLEGWDETVSVMLIQPLSPTEYCDIETPRAGGRCYFHKQEYYESLNYALKSGSLFNLREDSFYVRAMIDTCIDEYKKSRRTQTDDSDMPEGVLRIINYIFEQSLNPQNISHLLGISVECNRLDLLETALRRSPSLPESLHALLKLLEDFNYPEPIRNSLLHLAATLFGEIHDSYGVFLCRLYLNDLDGLTTLLLETASQNPALACQFAFILVHLDDPHLLRFVLARLPADATSLRAILSKQFTNDLWSQIAAFTSSYQTFLTRRSHHDNRLLDEYVRFVTYEDTNVQEAMLVANALTSIGSGNEFVMNNGNWVKKAESWTKFGIIASFALSHVYRPEKAEEVMQNYIGSDKEEEKSGGLYGYAILHMSDGEQTEEAVRAQLRRVVRENSEKEMLLHGCCLGAGLVFCGSHDQGLTAELLACIQDKPFAGLGAGVAVGLVNCGGGVGVW